MAESRTGAECFAAEGLAVGYRGRALVRDIGFRLGEGRILTLVGPNGAGKSTILKTVCGQIPAVEGCVRIGGRDIRRIPRGELAKKMAVVLTERVRPELMTCFEAAALGRYPHTGRFGALTESDRAVVRGALSRVGAEELAEREFSELSDGQRQRVLLARALAQEPEVLVLDEPTSFLDIRHKTALLEILYGEAREKGRTVLMAMHEIALAEEISDLVLAVGADGTVRLGEPRELLTDSFVAKLFGMDPGRAGGRFWPAARHAGW